jgi:ubiquitin carboxyl-terminal hydrolase 36/42
VHCLACGHNSDTFDSILDLSLDLGNRANTLRDALDNFVRIDKLSGQNKYKCEKCVSGVLCSALATLRCETAC